MGRWLWLARLPGRAQRGRQERKYAIMSLIGDGLLIVYRDRSTGSNIDRNVRNFAVLKSPALDNTTVLAIDDAMRRRDQEVKTLLLGGRDPALLALQTRGLEEGNGVALLLPVLRPIAVKAGATHLVLATKHRDEARIKLADGSVGAGRIEGLGFYLDMNARLLNQDSREATQGYIAPSDTSPCRSSISRTARCSPRRSCARASPRQPAGGRALGAITPEQKAQIIQDLIRKETQRAVPLLFAKP